MNNTMTNDDAVAVVLALQALNIQARVEARTSTPILEDGSYGETRTIISVFARISDRTGNMVVREWTEAPSDLAKEIAAMRRDLKAASKLTSARVKAERESK